MKDIHQTTASTLLSNPRANTHIGFSDHSNTIDVLRRHGRSSAQVQNNPITGHMQTLGTQAQTSYPQLRAPEFIRAAPKYSHYENFQTHQQHQRMYEPSTAASAPHKQANTVMEPAIIRKPALRQYNHTTSSIGGIIAQEPGYDVFEGRRERSLNNVHVKRSIF
jgi:hypothetical protein